MKRIFFITIIFLFAFSAIATAQNSGSYNPSLSYDTVNKRYLVVYIKGESISPTVFYYSIYGQILNADGTAYGSEFVIATDVVSDWGEDRKPSVAYDSQSERFLVAWEDERNNATTDLDIYGQIVYASGGLYGSNFSISTAAEDQGSPSVAYDSVNRRFLVAWQDRRNIATTGIDIYGQILNANGFSHGSNFAISTNGFSQQSPSVAFDWVDQRFLVAWVDGRTYETTGTDIYGQLVNANGSLYGTTSATNFDISTGFADQFEPSVAFGLVGTERMFFVVWNDGRLSDLSGDEIYGQFVSNSGDLIDSVMAITVLATGDQHDPSVAFDSANERFLVVWDDHRTWDTTRADIYGQLVNSPGSLDGSNFPISTTADGQYAPSVAYNNSQCGNFLVAFEDENETPPFSVSEIRFALVGEECPDLIVESITTDPISPAPGESVWVTVTIKNQGVGDATNSFWIDFYENLAAPPGAVVGDFDCQVDNLPAGVTTTCLGTTSYPSEGTYTMWAQVDTDQDVIESNEDNNIFGPQSICVIPGGEINKLVAWYYWSILDRCPEPGGAESWTAEIERIVSLGIDEKEGFIALGKLFFNSEEYLSKGKSDNDYIIDLYETFLGRSPSEGEVTGWAGELAGGLTRNLLLNYFIFSEEFRTYMEDIFGPSSVRPEYVLVNDQYRGFLSRLPDSDGYNYWLSLMQEAQCTGEQAVRNLTNEIGLLFIQSAEYEARNPELSNPDFSSEFVTNLYDGILRRGAELAGYLGWKDQYDSGALTKEEILQAFVDSAEFQGRVQAVIDAGCVLP